MTARYPASFTSRRHPLGPGVTIFTRMFSRVSAVGILLFLASCDSISNRNTRGPIALGNASTIVTEADSQYLQDMVPDPAFDAPAAPARDTIATAVTPPLRDTVKATPAAGPANAPVQAGLTADFGDVQITFPGVAARDGSKSVRGGNSAAYTLSGTGFGGKVIAVRGGTVQRIQQRTGYSAVVEIGGKPVLLSDISTMYTGWQSLSGKSGDYTLASASPPSIKIAPAAVRTAVQKAARKQRLDRKAEQKLLASVKSLSTPPLSVVPRAFTWKIDGTDAKGKAFSKEVRVDVPL